MEVLIRQFEWSRNKMLNSSMIQSDKAKKERGEDVGPKMNFAMSTLARARAVPKNAWEEEPVEETTWNEAWESSRRRVHLLMQSKSQF